MGGDVEGALDGELVGDDVLEVACAGGAGGATVLLVDSTGSL